MKQCPDEILQIFRIFPGPYQRDAVNACLENREAMTKRLLVELDDWVSSDNLASSCYGMMPFYALTILSHWREERAHPLVVKLFSLPDEKIQNALGDHLTESGKEWLYFTCGGDLSGIRSIIQNEDAFVYARWGAINALQMCALAGLASVESVRKEIASHLSNLVSIAHHDRSLLSKRIEGDLYTFSAAIITAITDLHPGEHMSLIKDAFDAGIVDDFIISMDFVLESCEMSPEEVLDMTAAVGYISVHDAMEDWACFNPVEYPAVPALKPLSYSRTLPHTNENKKKKVGRNDACFCGSGKKYKKCCLGCDVSL
jgi:hypothetical protein